MRAVILYSRHETGQQEQAQALAQQLGAYATAVDLADAYGELGPVLRDLLGPREFPCVVFVQDHLAGAPLAQAEYVQTVAAEQHDIESREFRQTVSDHLGARLAAAQEAGREEIRTVIREAAKTDALIEPADRLLNDEKAR